MFTQKQWSTMIIGRQLEQIAISLIIEVVRQRGERKLMVREQAVIAEEIRNIAEHIIKAAEQNIFGDLSDNALDTMMTDIAQRGFSFLATNAVLLASKNSIPELGIFAEELQNYSVKLCSLYGCAPEYEDILTAYPVSRVIPNDMPCLSATSGKYKWYENTRYVTEILAYHPEFIQGSRLILKNEWRDMDMPFIQLGEATRSSGIAIIADSRDPKKFYAVLIDSQSIIITPVGINKPCELDIPVRECWATAGDGEIIFPDWEKIAGVISP